MVSSSQLSIRSMARLTLSCLVLLALTCGLTWAQETTGGIAGKVVDASGAAIPGAKVEVSGGEIGRIDPEFAIRVQLNALPVREQQLAAEMLAHEHERAARCAAHLGLGDIAPEEGSQFLARVRLGMEHKVGQECLGLARRQQHGRRPLGRFGRCRRLPVGGIPRVSRTAARQTGGLAPAGDNTLDLETTEQKQTQTIGDRTRTPHITLDIHMAYGQPLPAREVADRSRVDEAEVVRREVCRPRADGLVSGRTAASLQAGRSRTRVQFSRIAASGSCCLLYAGSAVCLCPGQFRPMRARR